jgi:hypothetical protein
MEFRGILYFLNNFSKDGAQWHVRSQVELIFRNEALHIYSIKSKDIAINFRPGFPGLRKTNLTVNFYILWTASFLARLTRSSGGPAEANRLQKEFCSINNVFLWTASFLARFTRSSGGQAEANRLQEEFCSINNVFL